MGLKFLLLALFGLGVTAVKLRHEEDEAADQVKYAWYSADEDENGACENDDDCDGQRTCSDDNVCEGEARPEKGPDYSYDESLTGNQCSYGQENADYYCNGARTCSQHGFCTEVTEPVENDSDSADAGDSDSDSGSDENSDSADAPADDGNDAGQNN